MAQLRSLLKGALLPFRLETDEDKSVYFLFFRLGSLQLLLCHVFVTTKSGLCSAYNGTRFLLEQCDYNKDVEIDGHPTRHLKVLSAERRQTGSFEYY